MSLPTHHHITGGHLRQEPLEWPQNQNATGNGQAPTGTSHNFPHPSGHQHATAAQYYQYNSVITRKHILRMPWHGSNISNDSTQNESTGIYTATHAARFNQINWYCNEAEELCSTWLGPCGLQ